MQKQKGKKKKKRMKDLNEWEKRYFAFRIAFLTFCLMCGIAVGSIIFSLVFFR